MYENHIWLEGIGNNDKIWRYMSFDKFVEMLERRSLFFCRSDRFDDKFEGSFPKGNATDLKEIPEKDILSNRIFGTEIIPLGVLNQVRPQLRQVFKEERKNIMINCWHINEYESEAMWKLYSQVNAGIAIQSTYERLKECFSVTDKHIFISKVKYLDYETDFIREDFSFEPFICKRKSFEYEKELRAMFDISLYGKDKNYKDNLPEYGMNIDIDIDKLIEKVYISPLAAEWFGELVKNIVKRYDIKKEVRVSKLCEEPFY